MGYLYQTLFWKRIKEYVVVFHLLFMQYLLLSLPWPAEAVICCSAACNCSPWRAPVCHKWKDCYRQLCSAMLAMNSCNKHLKTASTYLQDVLLAIRLVLEEDYPPLNAFVLSIKNIVPCWCGDPPAKLAICSSCCCWWWCLEFAEFSTCTGKDGEDSLSLALLLLESLLESLPLYMAGLELRGCWPATLVPRMSLIVWLPEGDLLLSLSLMVGGIAVQFSLMLTWCSKTPYFLFYGWQRLCNNFIIIYYASRLQMHRTQKVIAFIGQCVCIPRFFWSLIE